MKKVVIKMNYDFKDRILLIPKSKEDYEKTVQFLQSKNPVKEECVGWTYYAVFEKDKKRITYLVPNLYFKLYENGYNGNPKIPCRIRIELGNNIEKILEEELGGV